MIAFINGIGTTTEIQNYSFIDENLENGTYKYRLIQIDFDGTRTEIGQTVAEINSFPSNYSLSQNYPNPFNPTTEIEFRIADFEFVTLKIYDLLGREVATLINEEKSAGKYVVEFDGSTLSSGIYFYRLNAGKYTETKKLILMK